MNKGDLVYMTTCKDRKIKGVVIVYRINNYYHTLDRYEVFIFKSAVRRWFFQQDLIKFE